MSINQKEIVYRKRYYQEHKDYFKNYRKQREEHYKKYNREWYLKRKEEKQKGIVKRHLGINNM